MSKPTSEIYVPTSAFFCSLQGQTCLWGGFLIVFFGGMARGNFPFVIGGLSISLSSTLFFAIAEHLKQQAVSNYLLKIIASKDYPQVDASQLPP
jgi:hypothetical protein